MYAQEIARGCVHNVTKSLLFCCVNILNAALEKRSTAFNPLEDMIFNRINTAFLHADKRLQGERDILGFLE